MGRANEIVKVSYKGIAANVLLVIFKSIIGLMANSISVVLDAVNNLSDVLSSVVTIVGTKFASRGADKEHPYGHGRIEYIASSIVSLIVLVAGVVSMKESITKIFRPEVTNFTAISIVIIVSGIITKFFLGRYYIKKGGELNSNALIASGKDASFDSIVSTGTLLSAIVSLTLNVNIEGVVGAIISLFILKAGIEIMQDNFNHIIGIRVDNDVTNKIKFLVNTYPEVLGAYDLILHNYGPEELIGSIHIEIDDDLSAKEIDTLSRKITMEVYKKLGVMLTIGIYASNIKDEHANEIRDAVHEETSKHKEIIQMHGFFIDEYTKAVSFDVIIDFDTKNQDDIVEKVKWDLVDKFPDYKFFVNIDRDFSD